MFHKIIMTFVLCALITFQNQTLVFAHGNGVSFEETKDGYFIDIGYNVPAVITMEPVRFDFLTYPVDTEDRDGEIFTDVWVRIAQDEELFFSGGINKPTFGSTGFTYMFPEEGTYEILARFQNDGDAVIETSFTLDVLPPTEEKSKDVNPLIAGGVGIIVGMVVMFLIPRRKK